MVDPPTLDLDDLDDDDIAAELASLQQLDDMSFDIIEQMSSSPDDYENVQTYFEEHNWSGDIRQYSEHGSEGYEMLYLPVSIHCGSQIIWCAHHHLPTSQGDPDMISYADHGLEFASTTAPFVSVRKIYEEQERTH